MIYVFLAEGFEEIEALTPVDILRRAGHEVRTVGIGSSNCVRGAHGIPVVTDITDAEYCDIKPKVVILPGGIPGAENLYDSSCVNFAAEDCVKHGGLLCSICAAPLVAGRLGLLKGKKVTVFPGFEHELCGAEVVEARVVRDGNIITARGMGCAEEFALAIVEALDGKEKADAIARSAFIK
ncbi:MAG: DJ-1 family glyoxalase III [Eubacteriales bacterium]